MMTTTTRSRTRDAFGAWAVRLLCAAALLWIGVAVPGADLAPDWTALAARGAAARADYQKKMAALEKAHPAANRDEAAILAYLAAGKLIRDDYLKSLQAEAQVGIALAVGIDWHPAAALLGQEYLHDGRFESAAAAYDRALLDPWKAESDPARFQTVLDLLNQLPAEQRAYLNRHQAWVCYRLGTVMERGGKPKQAVRLYRNALTLDRRPRYLLALALARSLHADFEKARQLLAEASQATGQKNALIEYHLGYCLEKLWQLEPAGEAYERARALASAARLKTRPPVVDAIDGLGLDGNGESTASWDLALEPFTAQQARDRARARADNLAAGERDASGRAYALFQQASELDQENLEEKGLWLNADQADRAESELFGRYESLMSQAVVAFPRFVPALVKAGVIKVNRGDLDQAQILFQSALEVDSYDPAALIYFAQTLLKRAGENIDQLDRMLNRRPDDLMPALTGAQLQEQLTQALKRLQPLPEIGKRLAELLDKHAIGYEIKALAECEQVHANTFRKDSDRAADQAMLAQANRDYLQARSRGGQRIDLFEKMRTHDQASPGLGPQRPE